jgi:hypothetical protein
MSATFAHEADHLSARQFINVNALPERRRRSVAVAEVTPLSAAAAIAKVLLVGGTATFGLLLLMSAVVMQLN